MSIMGGKCMKTLFAILLSFILTLSLVGCNNSAGESNIIKNNSEIENVGKDTKENNEKWKNFLNDYENWVDEYVEFMKKYKENPTDLSLLKDYADLAKETLQWSDKAENIKLELENDTEALSEYINALSGITTKILNAAK